MHSEIAGQQRDRLILWLPIALMAGAACYFVLPTEPPVWAAWGAFLAAGGMAALCVLWPARKPAPWASRLRMGLAGIGLLIAAGGLGAGAAQMRTAAVATPRLAGETAPVIVEGWVADADAGVSRPRLKVLVKSIEGVPSPPRYVRISTARAGALQPGRAVRCRAILRSPEGPMAPGAYNPAYNAYFARIGGVGFSLGACRPTISALPSNPMDAAIIQVAAMRRAITETVYDSSPTPGGALAAALITGDRSLVDRATNDALRDAGLGHLISVSGLHMALVAGMIYAALHVGLVLIPGMALRFPVRKWAAGAAIAGAGIYLVLSGNSVPAQRAFVMTAVVLGAILMDRPAITMRGLAAAALIVVLLSPESVLTPGFQMSFAASAALVAAFEGYAKRRDGPDAQDVGMLIGALQSGWRWMSGALLASAVAGLATDPFALYHFQRFTFYALPANLAATPIVSLIVAPAAGAAAALAPFGLAEPALWLMSAGLDVLTSICAVFAERPEAVRGLPKPPDIAFLLWIGAIAWACLWHGRARWFAVVLLGAGVAIYVTAPKPMLWTDGGLDAVVARAAETQGARWVAAKQSETGATFETERLAGMAGIPQRAAKTLAGPEQCSDSGCVWRTPGGRVAGVAYAAQGLAPLCVRGAVVISRAALPDGWQARCNPAVLIDPASLQQRGGAAVTETTQGLIVQRARGKAHKRAWDGALTRTGE